MLIRFIAVAAALFFLCPMALAQRGADDWNQGAGPAGCWRLIDLGGTYADFSVRTGKHIAWRTPLPETGQGGIAFHGNRVFVATMAPWDPKNALSKDDAERYSHAIEKRSIVGKDIDAHCIDASTGKILWTRRIEAEVPSIYSYPFSDATSASPATDGEHVWFTNGGGTLVCYTIEGEEVWRRKFTPTFDGPFNKQFEPLLISGNQLRGKEPATLIHMEPDQDGWNYLWGLEAKTGKVLWRSEDALTHYNCPTLHSNPETGELTVVHARGGPHAVPERPVGFSVTAVLGENAGKTVGRYEDSRGNHEASLHNMTRNKDGFHWVLKEPRSAVVVVDPETMKEVREISLTQGVTLCMRDPETGEYVTKTGVNLEKGVFPARYSTIAAEHHLYFQCYATAWGKPTLDPGYCFARVNTQSGLVEYLEVPTQVQRKPEGDEYIWRDPGQSKAVNSRGVEVTGDDRSRWGGWDWVFNGSPSMAYPRVWWTTSPGLVYCLNVGAKEWNQEALAGVSDLGPAGETWTANSLSLGGRFSFHRTARELICIGRKPE